MTQQGIENEAAGVASCMSGAQAAVSGLSLAYNEVHLADRLDDTVSVIMCKQELCAQGLSEGCHGTLTDHARLSHAASSA